MMRTTRHTLLFLLLGFSFLPVAAQTLKPGFDKSEYIELLKAYSRWGDSTFYEGIPASERFQETYRSPVVGLENRWELYTDDQHVAVISIRGTTAAPTSWLANFYAAMVPAKGTLQLSDSLAYSYNLAEDPKAAVHVGWLVSMAYLSADILTKIDSCYATGIKDYIIFGHSQGGAIAYLLTTQLRSQINAGALPSDIRLKTYCSAAPKPGNLYFAYSFEEMAAGGWGFNVVNAADWVPETPVSIQTVSDFNTINPFLNAKEGIKQQKLKNRIAMKHLYKQLTKDTERAQKRYEKYLGRMTSKFVKKHLPEFQTPEYFHSNHYVRTGNFVILMPDEAYYEQFPNDKSKVFNHHHLQAYLRLAKQLEE